MTQPLVSIGISVFNCEGTIEATLNSILYQSYQKWEMILIDDGSEDDTLRIIERFKDSRIKVFADGENKGLASRLNQAVAMSSGKYFARIDGDDIAFPDRLAKQVEHLESHSDIDLLGTKLIVFDDDGNAIGGYPFRQTHGEICSRPWAGFYLYHPTWMGKTDWFRMNQYNPEMVKSQDQELLMRTYQNSKFESLPEILIGYRKPSLSLKTILLGRYLKSKTLYNNFLVEKDFKIILGIFEQFAKALVDIAAITSGLNYRILRHRALPLQQEDILAWNDTWALLHQKK